MRPTIAILGASGVYGRHLVPRLLARGFAVRALVRVPAAATAAAACGADARRADIFDEEGMVAGLRGCAVAVNLATALRLQESGVDFDLNDRVRREGVPMFLRACARAGVERVVQQSIAMVHAAGDAWADEDTPLSAPAQPVAAAAIAAMRDAEAQVQASALGWSILRGGLFYGPGTAFDERWFALARAGRLRLPGDGSDYVSLVHIADMAAATVAAIERGVAGRALVVADDMPVRWRELFGFIAASVGASPPAPGGQQGFPSFRVRNARAREALEWAPFHADYRAGLAR